MNLNEFYVMMGTTQLSCIDNDCYYYGSEIIKETFDIAVERINNKKNKILIIVDLFNIYFLQPNKKITKIK